LVKNIENIEKVLTIMINIVIQWDVLDRQQYTQNPIDKTSQE